MSGLVISVGIFLVGWFLVGFIQKRHAKKLEEGRRYWKEVWELEENIDKLAKQQSKHNSGPGRTFTTVTPVRRTNTARVSIHQRPRQEDKRRRSSDDDGTFITNTVLATSLVDSLPERSISASENSSNTDSFSGGGGSFGGGGASGSWDNDSSSSSSSSSSDYNSSSSYDSGSSGGGYDSGSSGSFGSD